MKLRLVWAALPTSLISLVSKSPEPSIKSRMLGYSTNWSRMASRTRFTHGWRTISPTGRYKQSCEEQPQRHFLFLQACRKAAFSELPSSWCMQTTPRMFSLKASPRPRTPMTPPCTASSAHQQQLSLSALHFKPGSITWQHGAPNGESSSSQQNHRHWRSLATEYPGQLHLYSSAA